MEEWREIPGYSGYLASDLGRIKSLSRKRWQWCNGTMAWVTYEGRIRRQSPCPQTRYLKVGLSPVQGPRRTEAVHVLVCSAFHGPRPDNLDVGHINGDRQDNRAANLKWCTRKENLADRKAHGTLNSGERNGAAKLTNAQWDELVELRRAGVPVRELSARFGLRESSIYGRLKALPA